jgi:hypothetical protein
MGRKKYSKELKARIALDAIKGQKTIAELASEYGVHANQISIRKTVLDLGATSQVTNSKLIFSEIYFYNIAKIIPVACIRQLYPSRMNLFARQPPI